MQMRRVAVAAAVGMPVCLMSAPSATAMWRHGTTTPVVPSEGGGRRFSRLGMDGFTDVTYNTAADLFLDHVDNVLEAVDSNGIEEVQLAGGVLSIETGAHGTFVLNKQAPNVQLWLSSPLSGPHHYDMVLSEGDRKVEKVHDVQWLADSDGHSLKEKLERELTETLGVEVKL
ncbi:frataxin-like, mitochondrial precursor [Trypanosoma rangeli]|uniref:ferroxidase n=1 Tax=Trypanosoma rangeli TaxID=5698 RepID=A0A422NXL2_TRYRA|nr:frataxin-like, mitochondrial precursor [Trypanosoma rangeli]RNF10149.1 frataxin-like, mitochondrial precursor [Trypanosoma rangeli]|eukprot:RNF10149.1 frataxin-like, mitochondrial precursor [Trypanosoma rangeli]